MKNIKHILAGLLVAMMLVIGLVITPMKADAAETEIAGTNGVVYVLDNENYKYTTLWTNKTVPTREGYVFGGWYTRESDDSFTAIKQSEGSKYTEAYAKFVPAEVLSVRAQLEAATETNSGTNIDTVVDGQGKETTYLRLLSAVNGLDYQKVGFEILYNKTFKDPTESNNTKANNITKVYKTITNSETDNTATSASSIFGAAATHFSVLRLDGIYATNFDKVIYVRPHWTTLDGTTVYGQAKYIRVMDGYASNHYISVPINFLTGSEVAAGQLEISYDSDKLEVVQVDGMPTAGFDAGTLMTEMSYYDDKAGKIKVVGNVATAPSGDAKGVEPESQIYANVWFKEKTTQSKGTVLKFEVSQYSFCNWEETLINDVTAWNVKYLK